MKYYEVCLADYECILPLLAELLGASYQGGAFTAADNCFHEQRLPFSEWVLSGVNGRLVIRLEQYEGYYFATLTASDRIYATAREVLHATCLAQGGNARCNET